jgi:hypothetical protein
MSSSPPSDTFSKNLIEQRDGRLVRDLLGIRERLTRAVQTCSLSWRATTPTPSGATRSRAPGYASISRLPWWYGANGPPFTEADTMSADEGRVPHCLPPRCTGGGSSSAMDVTNVATHRPRGSRARPDHRSGSAKPHNIWPIRCQPALRGPCREATMSAGRPVCAAGGEGRRSDRAVRPRRGRIGRGGALVEFLAAEPAHGAGFAKQRGGILPIPI